ncbi:MAG: hypothetical protein U0183_34635 [Polyangiaceae bacterium]
MDVGSARTTILDDGAETVGALWARDVHANVVREGRPALGGWPGTLGEARARIAPFFRAELTRLGMTALSVDESRSAATTAYRKARRVWLDLQA